MSYSFKRGQRFVWKDIAYVVTHTQKNIIRIETLSDGSTSGERKNVELKELNEAWKNSELQFEVSKRLANPLLKDKVVVQNKYFSWEDVDQALRKKAEWRLEVIQPLLDVKNRTREMVRDRATNKKLQQEAGENGYALSEPSIYRWIAWYEETNRDIRSLLDDTEGHRGGAGKKRSQDRVVEIFNEVVDDIYLKREGASMQDVHDRVEELVEKENEKKKPEEKLEVPSYPTITRWISKLDLEAVLTARHGKDAARNQIRQYGKMVYPDEPLVRLEMDFTTMDLIVLDRNGIPLGRLSTLLSLDTATRYPHGYSTCFGSGGYLSVAECLRYGIQPKNTREQYNTMHEWLAYGIPRELVTDRALVFTKSQAFIEACLTLGITLIPADARQPVQKPAIERFIRTKHKGKIHTLPGTTFSNILQKGDYNPVEQACIFVDQIDEILNLFFVDEYAQRSHRGLEGDTPAQRWAMKTQEGFSPNFPGSVEELDIILRPFDYRHLWHYGIMFKNIRYNDIDNVELGVLRVKMEKKGDEKVKIKYDPSDLNSLYVFDPFEEPNGRYIKIPSLDPDYTTGLTLYQHEVIRRYAHKIQKAEGKKINKASLWRARARISEMAVEGFERKDKLKTNRHLAYLWTGGKPTRNQEPSALSRPNPEQSEVENIPQLPPQEIIQPLFKRDPYQDTLITFDSQDPTN
jgi:putative transposase